MCLNFLMCIIVLLHALDGNAVLAELRNGKPATQALEDFPLECCL